MPINLTKEDIFQSFRSIGNLESMVWAQNLTIEQRELLLGSIDQLIFVIKEVFDETEEKTYMVQKNGELVRWP